MEDGQELAARGWSAWLWLCLRSASPKGFAKPTEKRDARTTRERAVERNIVPTSAPELAWTTQLRELTYHGWAEEAKSDSGAVKMPAKNI